MCGRLIPPESVTAVFGVTSGEVQISSSQASVIAFALLLARRCILQQWKFAKSPSSLCWVKEVLAFLPLEKLSYSRGKSSNRFHNT